MRWLLALALSAVLAASACGGGDGTGGSPAPSPLTLAPAPADTAPATPDAAATAEDILLALLGRGLPVGEYAVYGTTSDPEGLLGQPGQYTSRINFADRRVRPLTDEHIDPADGGAIEVFVNEDDARARYLDVQTANPGQRAYIEGVALLRITGELTAAQASEYEEAFRTITRGE